MDQKKFRRKVYCLRLVAGCDQADVKEPTTVIGIQYLVFGFPKMDR
jgi:hypothetical protein